MSDGFDPFASLIREDPSANLDLTPLVPPEIAEIPRIRPPAALLLAEHTAPAPFLKPRGPSAPPLLPLPQQTSDPQLAQANALTRAPVRAVNTMADWFSARPGHEPRINPEAPAQLNQMLNKLRDLAPLYEALSDTQRAALLKMDQDRLRKGAAPLSKPDTARVAQMFLTGKPTTPPKERDWNPLKNFAYDLGDIVKGLNPITFAKTMYREGADVFNMFRNFSNPTYHAERARGVNPFTAFLRSPGIRMIPGAYTAGNIADGKSGIAEVGKHPLMTFLDVLPAAHGATGGVKVGGRIIGGTETGLAGREIAAAANVRHRPLRDVLFNRVERNPDGSIVRQYQETLPPHLDESARRVYRKDWRVDPLPAQLAENPAGLPVTSRTPLGQAWDQYAVNTRLGKSLQQFGGKGARRLAQLQNEPGARMRAIYSGRLNRATLTDPAEVLLADVGEFNRKWEKRKDAPEGFYLGTGELSPAQAAKHEKLIDRLERGDLAGIPNDFVDEYRALTDRSAALNPEDLGRYVDEGGPEWYPMKTAQELHRRDQRVEASEARHEIYQHILEPEATADMARAWANRLARRDDDFLHPREISLEARLITDVLAQYGIDVDAKLPNTKMSLRQYASAIAKQPAARGSRAQLAAAKRIWAGHVREAIELKVESNQRTLGHRNYLGPHPETTDSLRAAMSKVERELAADPATTSRKRLSARTFTVRVRDGLLDPNPKHLKEAFTSMRRVFPHIDANFLAELELARKRIMASRRASGVPSAKALVRLRERRDKFRAEAAPARMGRVISDAKQHRMISEIMRYYDTQRSSPLTDALGRELGSKKTEAAMHLHGPVDADGVIVGAPRLPKDLTTESRAFGPNVAQVQRLHSKGEIVAPSVTAEEAGHIALAVFEGRYSDLGFDPGSMRQFANQIEREVSATWRNLVAEGTNPVFVHRVSPARLNETFHPAVDPVPEKPSQVKERQVDMTPRVNDLQLSLTHQAMEVVQRDAQIKMVDLLAEKAGWTQDELVRKFRLEADWEWAKFRNMNFEAFLEKAMKRAYVKLDPVEAGFSWGGTKYDKYSGGDVWIPRYMRDNLKEYGKQANPVSHAMDAVNNVFRLNVIGLAPGVTLNNALSNVVAQAIEDPRSFTKFRETWRMVRDPSTAPEQLATMFTQEYHAWPGWAKSHLEGGQYRGFYRDKVIAGVNARHAWTESITNRIWNENRRIHPVERSKKIVQGLADANVKLQILGDMVARGMPFLKELERGKTAGLTTSEATAAALAHSQRIIINYMEFTPLERAAMRTVIPFYSYASFAARFAARFPFDHPARIAIMGAVARIISDDMESQPGSRFGFVPIPAWMPLLGTKGPDGSQTFLATRPFDPFSGVADMASVQGWFASTNPVISTALERVGIKHGEQDLYPTMRWNPETRQMEAVPEGSVLGMLFENTAPRLQALLTPLGLNSRYNELREEPGNEDAATRALSSGAGIPQLWRRRNPLITAAQEELNRNKSQSQALSNALRRGRWDEAKLYPGLKGQRKMYEYLLENNSDWLLSNYGMDRDPKTLAAILNALAPSGDSPSS